MKALLSIAIGLEVLNLTRSEEGVAHLRIGQLTLLTFYSAMSFLHSRQPELFYLNNAMAINFMLTR
jgi:hypothetical protein